MYNVTYKTEQSKRESSKGELKSIIKCEQSRGDRTAQSRENKYLEKSANSIFANTNKCENPQTTRDDPYWPPFLIPSP